MESLIITLKTLKDTERLGCLLGKDANPGDVICLDGDLGVGKTAMAQAIARGLKVPASCYVTSPSFAILHEYEGRLTMYHMDFYRLSGSDEVADLGFEEYFYLNGLTVIEWADRACDILPSDRLALKLVLNEDFSRTVTMQCTQRYESLLKKVSKEFI